MLVFSLTCHELGIRCSLFASTKEYGRYFTQVSSRCHELWRRKFVWTYHDWPRLSVVVEHPRGTRTHDQRVICWG